MEKAIFTKDLEKLKSGEYDRLYYGEEFCQTLIPSSEEIKSAVEAAENSNVKFTLVTPYVTDKGMEKIKPLLDLLYPETEVIVNDWGVFNLIRKSSLTPVIGRLLIKQKRDPRINDLKGSMEEDAFKEQFNTCSIGIPEYNLFLRKNNVHRIELDNSTQGPISLKDTGFRGSLYTPYAYVTTTRKCLVAKSDSLENKDYPVIGPCSRECNNYTVTLSHPDMPKDLILRGNTQFIKKDTIPTQEELESYDIDRLVIIEF